MLRYHDRAVDYRALEGDLVRDDLASLSDLKRVTSAEGLATQVFKTNRRGLELLPKPLIAHLESIAPRGQATGHFVLVLKTDDKDVECIDGTTAEPRTIPWPEFERDWSGHLLAPPRPDRLPWSLGLAIGGIATFLGYYLMRYRSSCRAILGRIAGRAGRRKRLSATAALLLAFQPVEAARGVDIPTLEMITRAYQDRGGSIRTIHADYHIDQKALLGPEAYYKATRNYEAKASDLTIVIASDGRRHQSSTGLEHKLDDVLAVIRRRKAGGSKPDPNDLAFADIVTAMGASPPTRFRQSKVFDGSKLWGFGEGKLALGGIERSTYSVIYIPALPSAYFATSPLDWAFWSFRMPAMPKDDALFRKHRIPDKFELDQFIVSAATERVGGDECVVLTAPGKETFWLLPERGYAVRKAEYLLEDQRVFVVESGDWRPMGEGGWVAGKVGATSFAIKNYYPAGLEGKAIRREDYTLTKLAVNDPASEDLLRVDPQTGELVVDQDLVGVAERGERKPLAGGGSVTPAVNYLVPAKREDLDRAIQSAVAADRAKNPESWFRSPALWIVVAVVVAGVVMGVRAARKS